MEYLKSTPFSVGPVQGRKAGKNWEDTFGVHIQFRSNKKTKVRMYLQNLDPTVPGAVVSKTTASALNIDEKEVQILVEEIWQDAANEPVSI